MEIPKDILSYDEQITIELRKLYRSYGYTPYRMSRFEEYELYARNKAFLPSGDILTFTDISGKLMALRPDVTLSIVKNAINDGKLKKLYYNENIYRSDGTEYKEQMQVGLECIGELDAEKVNEVLMLARQSLDIIADGRKTHLDIFHTEKKAEKNDLTYYDDLTFRGYIEGIPVKVLSGGRYDELLRKFGKNGGAIGFAVYLNLLEKRVPAETGTNSGALNVALPKGRLGEKAYEIFERSGYECPEIKKESRKLVFESPENGMRYFWVKPSDVAVYVERGAADIGVVGKDILLENSKDVYELLDLGIGKCTICVAAEKSRAPERPEKTLSVATKFPNIARSYYTNRGREIDVIELNGSIELAPLLGLSDVVVDIVETGKTLLENNMEPIEKIADISARLISNKASYKFNRDKIDELCAKIAATVES